MGKAGNNLAVNQNDGGRSFWLAFRQKEIRQATITCPPDIPELILNQFDGLAAVLGPDFGEVHAVRKG